MILLLGGTSETAALAEALADAGFAVLVSTATDNELNVGDHEAIHRRMGRLDGAAMEQLVKDEAAVAIVDATHPYAVEAQKTASAAAHRAGIPYFRFKREAQEYNDENIIMADDHADAARKAFAAGKPVLLTTGSRNLAPYVARHKATGIPVIARVLPHPESEAACKEAGLAPEQVVAERGPFTVDQNVELMEKHAIGVLVSKDSGKAGGVPDKLASARKAGCMVVLIKRPESEAGCRTPEELLKAVRETLG